MQKRIKLFLILAAVFSLNPVWAQREDGGMATIRSIMQAQEAAWNNGDLDGFMEGYWHTDSLQFIGSKGLTYGWDATLANYKKSYPDRATMGKLHFTLIKVEKLSGKAAFVIGKWHLKRDAGDLSGHFTLLWKKIKGKWLIVADHSS
ncbi:MAG: nuclear transport factor 2 family protein [Saprospiraceae bacterium]|nr:nuclear transport factor 2 family protein [Saprospiraceae bacterium]